METQLVSDKTQIAMDSIIQQLQAKAYKLADRIDYRGLPISIETKKGQTRKGIGADGKPWEVTMPFDYGYIRKTEGADGDHVDCFIGPSKDAEEVYVIHQCKESDPKKYDEDKVMLGFDNLEDAIKAYKSAYTGVDLFQGSHTFNFEDFVEEIMDKSNRGEPLECAEEVDEEVEAGGPGSGWYADKGHIKHNFDYPKGREWKPGEKQKEDLNGVKLKPKGKVNYEKLTDHSIEEPEKINRPKVYYTDDKSGEALSYRKHASAGVIVVEPDNKVWIYAPKNFYGGYVNTFSKGTLDKGEHPQTAAVRELHEETGIVAKIKGYLGDVERSSSVTRYYLGERVGGHPGDAKSDETHSVQLVPIDKDLTKRLLDVNGKETADHDVLDLLQKHLGITVDEPKQVDSPKVDFMAEKITGQKGSNPGGTYKGSDGVERYVKFYSNPDRGRGESVANTLYNDLGIGAPKSTIFEAPNGKEAFASEIISGGKILNEIGVNKEHSQAVLKGFAADVLTANWDSVGLAHDNILMKGGDAYRIDNGAVFNYRAQGSEKPAHLLNAISEFEGLANPNINKEYSKVFKAAGYKSAMDIPDIKQQVQHIVDLEHSHGSWEDYLDNKAPYLGDKQKSLIADMLSSRTELLAQKVGIKGPKLKAEADDLEAGGPGSGWTAANGHVGHGSLTTYKNLKKAGYKPIENIPGPKFGHYSEGTKWVKPGLDHFIVTHDNGWKKLSTSGSHIASGNTTVQLKQHLGTAKPAGAKVSAPSGAKKISYDGPEEFGSSSHINLLKNAGYVATKDTANSTTWQKPGPLFNTHSFVTTVSGPGQPAQAVWDLKNAKGGVADHGASPITLKMAISTANNSSTIDDEPVTGKLPKTPAGVNTQVPASGKIAALNSLGYSLTANKGEADVYTKPGEKYEVHLVPTDPTHSKFNIIEKSTGKTLDTGTVGSDIQTSLANIKQQVTEGKAIGVSFPSVNKQDVDKAWHTQAGKVVASVYDKYNGKSDKQRYDSKQIDTWKNNYINAVSSGAKEGPATLQKAAEGLGVYPEAAAKLGISPNQVKETQSLIENWTGSSKDSTRIAFNKAVHGADGANPGDVLEYHITQQTLAKQYPSGEITLTRGMNSSSSGLAKQLYAFEGIAKAGNVLPDWQIAWKSGGAESWSKKASIPFGSIKITTKWNTSDIFSSIDTNPKSFDAQSNEQEYIPAPKDFVKILSKKDTKIEAAANKLPADILNSIAYLQLNGWDITIDNDKNLIIFKEGPGIISGISDHNAGIQTVDDAVTAAQDLLIKVQAGGKGSGWTTEEGHVSHKVKLAKEAVQGKTKEQFNIKMQVTAENSENVLSKVLGGKSYNDTEPVDILVKHAGRLIGIEVKTLLFQTSDKITMNHGAIPRKLKWQRKTGAELYTVAIDARNPKKTVCYVRPGVGSWELQRMREVGSFADVKKVLEIGSKTDALPTKLPKTKAALGMPKDHTWEKPSKALRNFQVPKFQDRGK